MVYLDGDTDESGNIDLNDLIYLKSYLSQTVGYTIDESKIYNIAIKNENFDSNDGDYPYTRQAIDAVSYTHLTLPTKA